MHYRASWSSCSTQIKWRAAIYYWLTDELCRSAAFRFVSAFCFTCKRRWNKTEIKQSRLKQTWNKFVLFQFYFIFFVLPFCIIVCAFSCILFFMLHSCVLNWWWWWFHFYFTCKSRLSFVKKYKCEKRASNIALSYGVDVDKIITWLFYATVFVLNAKLCSIYALILEVFGGLNLVSLSVFFCFFVLFKKSGLIFKRSVATLRPTGSLRHVRFTPNVQCRYLSVLIRHHVMHPNTSVNSVN